MRFTQEIKRLSLGMLIAFALVALSAAYWTTFGTSSITKRDDNPRNVESETRLRRGMLTDRDNHPLAQTISGDDQIGQRQYLDPAFYSALGYASYRYGVNGAEAAFDPILRGDDLKPALVEQWVNGLLHHPQIGSDVMLSFDSRVQQTAAALMNGRRGAVVVLEVPSGQVLAMLSLPTFDPNTLDDNWSNLTQSPDNPFFNRALQGTYQPGGMLQTPLVAAAILTRQATDAPLADALQPIHLNNTELTCAETPQSTTLSLRQAFAYGCPYPFARLAETMGTDTVQAALDTFQLLERTTLEGFTQIPEGLRPQTLNLTPLNLLETALGQGQLRTTPLQMAVIAAAILNDGNAPVPYTLLATRPPNSSAWEYRTGSTSPIPITTAEVAANLRTWMRDAVSYGAAQDAQRKTFDIGGHVARAYSGKASQVWFIGFAAMGGRRGITVAVVLEDSDDPSLAARIGGAVLASAAHITPP